MGEAQHGDTILANLHKTLQFGMEYDVADVNIEKYKELAKQVCKTEHGFLLGSDMVKEASKQTDVEGFDQVLEEQRNETHPKFKAQDSKRYTDFAKKAQRLIDTHMGEPSQRSQNLDNSMDVDESQPQDLISDIDPITKTQLVHPVRNKHCNHIYGYESVQQLLQKNPRLRCPIVGCANKKHIQLSDLIEDEQLERRLAAQRKSHS